MPEMFRKLRRNRRSFMKLCMTAVTASQLRHTLAWSDSSTRNYNRVSLVGSNGRPLKSTDLEVGRNYVFHYPYVSTPCFLIDVGEPLDHAVELRQEDGQGYTWNGGVGHKKSIVAFSAICAHKMTHPAKSISFIDYRHETIKYRDTGRNLAAGEKLIYCCSEQSVYDAKRGAMVLGGPASQPLTAIALEYDENRDRLSAVGTRGGEMYDQFFRKFGSRLQLEYRVTDIGELVQGKTEVMLLENFSQTRASC